MTTFNRLSFAFLCLLVLAMLGSRTGLAAVVVHVEPVDQQHVRVVVSNAGERPVVFLRWGSPFEDQLTSDLFRIESMSGQRATFRGRLIKRGDPQPEDFINLASGEMIDSTIPIPRFYHLPSSGEYSISVEWASQQWLGSAVTTSQLYSNSVVVSLFKPSAVFAARPPSFDSCSASQQSILQQTLIAAEGLANTARDDLAGLVGDARYNSPRYEQWFGSYADDRFERVRSVFENMVDVLGSSTIRLNCDCDRAGWFAFVYPSQEYDVYLCPAFWRANLLGRDSKAGTLIHELTHFPSVGGTRDHAYSIDAASLTPKLAIDNADNYEYFAENEPELPIFNGVVFDWLENGIEVAGTLRQGQSSFYKVIAADSVELSDNSGGAVLFTYPSAAAENPICSSADGSGPSQCAIERDVVSYLEVFAVADADYRLLAENQTFVEVQSAPVTQGGGSMGAGLVFLIGMLGLQGRQRWSCYGWPESSLNVRFLV